MPLLHGLYQKTGKPLVMRLNILRHVHRMIEEVFADGSTQCRNLGITAHEFRCKFATSHYGHAIEVASRLLDALDMFQESLELLTNYFNGGRGNISDFGLCRHAGMHADAVLQYLGIFLDTIGRLAPYVVLEDPSQLAGEIDSLNAAANQARKGRLPNSVKDVYAKLSNAESWWHLGFARTVGLRQRVTHFPDLVTFQASGIIGEDLKVKASIRPPVGTGVPAGADFINTLTTVLAGACAWLDELDNVFDSILKSRAWAAGNALRDGEEIYSFALPINKTGEFQKYRDGYLFMPVCVDSDPISRGIRFAIVTQADHDALED